MIYLGIDVGAKGGISWIDGDKVFSEPYSDEMLISVSRDLNNTYATVEKVHAMPLQGVSSMFTFGERYGFILGVFKAFNVPYMEVPPRTWKEEFSLIGCDKKSSIIKCKELFPNVCLLPSPRSRKESDGMAESLLIAEYGRRRLKNEH